MDGKSSASLVVALFLVAATVAVPAPQQKDNIVEIVPPVSLQLIPSVDVYEVTVPLVLHINTTTWLSSLDNTTKFSSEENWPVNVSVYKGREDIGVNMEKFDILASNITKWVIIGISIALVFTSSLSIYLIYVQYRIRF